MQEILLDLPGSGARSRLNFKRKFPQIALQEEMIREEKHRTAERIWEWQQQRIRQENETIESEEPDPETRREYLQDIPNTRNTDPRREDVGEEMRTQTTNQQQNSRPRTTLDDEEGEYIPEEADLEEDIAWRIMYGDEWVNV